MQSMKAGRDISCSYMCNVNNILKMHVYPPNIKKNVLKINYCSSNQDKNFSILTDSITIGIELCKIPHISEHCP